MSTDTPAETAAIYHADIEYDAAKLDQFIADANALDRQAQMYLEGNPHIAMQMAWDDGYPYHGAIGGALSYVISPTSIGECFEVVFSGAYYKGSVNLTDYGSW